MTDQERIMNAFGKLNMNVTTGDVTQVNGRTRSQPMQGMPSRRAVVLFCGSDISLNGAFEGLNRLKSAGWSLTAIFSRGAERVLSAESIGSSLTPDRILRESEGVSIQDTIAQLDALIVPNITQNTLSKLAVGIQDELSALLAWQALVIGKAVVLNTDSVFRGWFDIDANRAMKRVMQAHLTAVKDFGAIIAQDHDYEKCLSADKSGRAKRAGKETRRTSSSGDFDISGLTGKKVLTERDIKELGDLTELTIGHGQILTPLGRDAAISRGIRLIYRRQR